MKYITASFLFFMMSCLIDISAHDANWSLLLYMEAPDLHDAVIKNITGLLEARTTGNADIYVQLHMPGSQAYRYRVSNGALQLNDTITVSYDYEKDIIDACNWAFSATKTQYHALMLWGHGCGILLPTWNEEEGRWQVEHDDALDICTECMRSGISRHQIEHHKAVLMNDGRRSYLTNENMVNVVKAVSENIIQKKLDVLGFDCCLGGMFEHAFQVSPYVQYLIGCQNCELPDGFDYCGLGKRISDASYTPRDLVAGIVQDYGVYYQQHAPKGLYTLAGFDCSKVLKIRELLDIFVTFFINELNGNSSRIATLKQLMVERSVRFCWMPMYTDLYTFLSVVEYALDTPAWAELAQEEYMAARTLIGAIKTEIQQAVVHNVTGHRMADAHGISIYLPYSHVDSSYYSTPFALNSAWLDLLGVITQG